MNKGRISLDELDKVHKGSDSDRKRAAETAEIKQKKMVKNSINKLYKK